MDTLTKEAHGDPLLLVDDRRTQIEGAVSPSTPSLVIKSAELFVFVLPNLQSYET